MIRFPNKSKELEKIIDKYFRNLKKNRFMVFLALALSHKRTGPSAFKFDYYNKLMMINDLANYFSYKFNFQRNKFIKLWNQFEKHFLNVPGHEIKMDETLKKIEFSKFRQTIFSTHSDIVEKEINYQIKRMNPQQKAIIFTFLEYKEDPEIPLIGSILSTLLQIADLSIKTHTLV